MTWFRVIWFVMALWLAAAGPWFVFIPVLIGYIVRFIGTEILLVTIVADSYFLLAPGHGPWFTIVTTVCLIVLQRLRPAIALYTRG